MVYHFDLVNIIDLSYIKRTFYDILMPTYYFSCHMMSEHLNLFIRLSL